MQYANEQSYYQKSFNVSWIVVCHRIGTLYFSEENTCHCWWDELPLDIESIKMTSWGSQVFSMCTKLRIQLHRNSLWVCHVFHENHSTSSKRHSLATLNICSIDERRLFFHWHVIILCYFLFLIMSFNSIPFQNGINMEEDGLINQQFGDSLRTRRNNQTLR